MDATPPTRPEQLTLSPISPVQSDMIRVARVLCILFMATTHIWPGSGRILAADVPLPLHLLYVATVDFLGRASVPLLSLISGFLFVYTFQRATAPGIVKSKLQSYIIPMIFWSLPIIALDFAEFHIRGNAVSVPASALDWLNSVLAITAGPANGPLHFLRDIFIMSFYAIGVLSVWKLSKYWGMAIAIAIFLIEQIPGGFLLFRNQIATFYIAGIFLAAYARFNQPPGWIAVLPLVAGLAFARAAGLFNELPSNPVLFRIVEHIPRIVMSLLMWRIAFDIALRANTIRQLALQIEPHIFTVFCIHGIVAKIFGGLAYLLTLSETAAYYPAIFLIQLIVSFVLGIAASKLLTPFPWLRGKSTRRRPPQSGNAASPVANPASN